jgi:hypothetical protein
VRGSLEIRLPLFRWMAIRPARFHQPASTSIVRAKALPVFVSRLRRVVLLLECSLGTNPS